MEEWRQYLNTRYDVSSWGNVRNRENGKVLKPALDNHGYPMFGCCHGGIQISTKVHRAVATAFLENPENFPTIDHIDRCRTNNRLENLRWASRSTQMRNRNSFGAIPFRGVSKDRNRFRALIRIDGKIKHIGLFDTPELASAAYEAALVANGLN